MKTWIPFFALLAVMAFSSCKDDVQEGTLVLHFKPVYAGSPLTTFQTFPFAGGQQIQFTHTSMMVADLQLFDAGSQRDLQDIALVNLTFDTPGEAAAGYSMTLNGVQTGQYTGLRFGIGVPPDLNEKKPVDFSSSSPLSNTGYYWTPWSSYIFSKTEGRLDTLGTGMFDLGFALHTGSDPLYRILQWAVPVTIEEGKPTSLDVVIDYAQLLDNIDIKSFPQNHNPQDTIRILQLVNHLANSITLVQ